MIKVLAKEFLNDKFIDNNLTSNIKLNDKIYFNKNNIYYFGNYDEKHINEIKNKLIKNKKRIINAINKNIKIILVGNSKEIFNNEFNINSLNIYTCSDCKLIKRIKNKNKIKNINNIDKPFEEINFRYKNLICIDNEKYILNILKRD